MCRDPRRRRACRRAALGLGLLALAACDSPTEVEGHPPSLYVQAFLTPGADPTVQVLEMGPPEEFYDGLDRFVGGAEVLVRSGDRAVALVEDSRSAGTYAVSHSLLPILAGQTYDLEVSHGGRQLRARTTVPRPAPVTRVVGDTITYHQVFGSLFGDLVHPGEFFWDRSPDAAGYVILVEALGVRSLPLTAEPLTADLDSLVARRDRARLAGAGADSLAVLERQVAALRRYFEENVTLVSPGGDTARWLRDWQQEDWEKIDTKDWSEGRRWRERREELYWNRTTEYWVPADSAHSDFWWAGVRFDGSYRVTLHAADRNYFDYATTAFNGHSGADSDRGPVFHVEGGLGVFGSYSSDSFEVEAVRGD